VYSNVERESTKRRINAWIRSYVVCENSAGFDAVFDLDGFLRTIAPSQLVQVYKYVDCLHPIVAWY